MATRAFTTFIPLSANGNDIRGAMGVQWTGLLNGDDGAPYIAPNHSDKCVQAKSTFGVGGTVILEGSNDQIYNTSGVVVGGTYFPLLDAKGNAISFTVAGGVQVLENPNAIRPRVTAGDGTTSLTVTMLVTTTARS